MLKRILFLTPLLLLLSLLSGEEIQMPNDRDLYQFMNQAEQVEFASGQELVRQGQSNIRSGEVLKNRRPSLLNPNEDLTPIHRQGEARVREGQQQVERGQRMMERARQRAFERYKQRIESGELLEEASREVAPPEPDITWTAPIATWDDFLEEDVREILESAWSRNITRLVPFPMLVSGNLEALGIKKEEFEAGWHRYLRRADRGRQTLASPDSVNMIYVPEGPEVHFREDGGGPRANMVYVILEMAVNPNGSAVVSARIMDSKSWKVLDSAVAILPDLPGASGGSDNPRLPPTRLNLVENQAFFGPLSGRGEPMQFSLLGAISDSIPATERLLLRQFLFEASNLNLTERDTILNFFERDPRVAMLVSENARMEVGVIQDSNEARWKQGLIQLRAVNLSNDGRIDVGVIGFN